MVEEFKVGVGLGIGGDPTFDPGSVHTVTIVITNLTAAAWVIDIMLVTGGLGPNPNFLVSQMWLSETLPAGGSVPVSAPITMLDTPGSYPTVVVVVERVTGTDQQVNIPFEDVIITTPAFEVGANLGWA